MLNISNIIAINSQRLLGFKSLCSFLFDGTNEFFVIDSVLPSILTNTTGAFLMVIKPEDSISPENKRVISFADTQGITNITVTKTTAGLLSVGCVNGAGTRWNIRTDSEVFSDTTWVTVCLVQDGVTPKIYIDGVFVSQSIISSVDLTAWFNDCPNLDNGRIGCLDFNNAGNSQFWDGAINQVSILDTDISAAQVLEWHNDLKPKNPKTLFGDNCVYFEKFDDAIWDSVNNEFGVFDAANPVFSPKSLLYDGINERLSIPNADLIDYLSGVEKKFSINIAFQRDSTTGSQGLFSGWVGTSGVLVRIESNDKLRLFAYSGGSLFAETNETITSTSDWNYLTVVYDYSQALGIRASIMLNGVALTTSSDNLSDTIASYSTDFTIGDQTSNNYFTGKINHLFITNTAMTLADNQSWFNNKDTSPQDLFGNDCVYLLETENGVYGGGNYTIEDTVNSITATSVNMEEEDLRYRAPNVGYSVNMEEEDKDCTENPY